MGSPWNSSVKDKSNLLSFNQWSGTDYSNNTSEFIKGAGIIFESSNEYSNIGNKSLKCIPSGDASLWAGLEYGNSIISKTIKLSGLCKTENSAIQIKLLELQENTTIQTETLNIPADTTQSFELTHTTGSENTRFMMQAVVSSEGGIVYLDNLNLEIQ